MPDADPIALMVKTINAHQAPVRRWLLSESEAHAFINHPRTIEHMQQCLGGDGKIGAEQAALGATFRVPMLGEFLVNDCDEVEGYERVYPRPGAPQTPDA